MDTGTRLSGKVAIVTGAASGIGAETARVFAGHGAKVMAFYGKLPADVKPSMLHDLEDGRRLELDWLNGQVVAFGRDLGIETPASAAVTEALKPFAAGKPAG